MNISKAVITAAGAGQRSLALQSIIDQDGTTKTALQILIEEAQSAGATDIAIVVQPGAEAAYAEAAGAHADRLHFIPQHEPRGYGDAIARARDFVSDDPFLHLVGDHLCLSRTDIRCARQLVAVAVAENCAVSAVQATRESRLPNFGAVGGKRLQSSPGLYAVEAVAEKPTPTEAEQTLLVPGLRAGHYLCFFGIHVLMPTLFDTLDAQLKRTNGNVNLSGALAELAGSSRYLAYEVAGDRFDIGERYGLLNAQLALALHGSDRSEILAGLIEILAR
ncbi:MAG: sugar phosphate nucleotidyltransferase [Chloroflexi bacterium]|nr:sugar phosphate nucleotidyltransferase [Chloroflexota bacterium]